MDEGNEVLERAVTVVVDEVSGASLFELDGRETGDAERSGWRNIVFGSLHLSTEQVWIYTKLAFGLR